MISTTLNAMQCDRHEEACSLSSSYKPFKYSQPVRERAEEGDMYQNREKATTREHTESDKRICSC